MKEVNIRKNRSGRKKIKEGWSRVSRIHFVYIFICGCMLYMLYVYMCV